MCIHGEWAELADKVGYEKAEKTMLLQNRVLARMRKEVDDVQRMSPQEFMERFVDPPAQAVKVLMWDYVAGVPSLLHRYQMDAAKSGKKLVFLDLTDEKGNISLVVRDEHGNICTRLLTWDDTGITGRHANIDPDCGLALSKDGSLRGRLMDEMPVRIQETVPA